jgi:hypothetical protein
MKPLLHTAVAVMLAWIVVAGINSSSVAAPLWNLANDSGPLSAETNSDEALPEIRASIVDRAGDEFIAKTEEGDEFRLPVEGAPPDTQIGDALALVPNPETQTIEVYKADPSDGAGITKPESQL